MKKSGLTLLETVIASFMLIFGILILGRLFHGGLNYGRQIEGRLVAAQIAENKMEEIRNWHLLQHRPVGNVDMTDWSPFTGPPQPDPNHPDYSVRVEVSQADINSPCSLFESRFADRRTFSLAKVTTTVYWENTRSAQLVTLMAPPTADWSPDQPNPPKIQIQSFGGSPVAKDDVISFQAQMVDPGGRPLPDVVVHWREIPVTEGAHGTATYPNRNSSRINYLNQAKLEDGTPVYTGGRLKLEAYADYNGARYSMQTEAFDLQP